MSQFSTAWYQSQLAKEAARSGRSFCDVAAGTAKESGLHDEIMAECRRRGWLAFHGSMAHKTFRTEGEPDFIILTESGGLLLVECKARTGKLSTEQLAVQAWAAKLGHTVHVVRSMADFLELHKKPMERQC